MFALYTELRRHNKLAEQRSPMFESNRFAKFWMYFMALFWIGYLIFFGTMFAFAMDGGSTEPYHVMNAGFIFVMVIDFMRRFAFQKTPTQEMKPYILLPVRKNRLIDLLLLRSGMNGYNLLWLFFYVPFGILTVTRFWGVWGVVTYSLGIWLLMLINTDEQVLYYGTYFIRVITPFYILICFNQLFGGALRGIGCATTPTAIMLASFVAFRQLYLFVTKLIFGQNLLAVSLAFPAGWLMCSLLLTIFYRRSRLFTGQMEMPAERPAEA